MKKVYNNIILLLVIALLIVGIMLVIKYGGNYKNEKEIKNSLDSITETIENNNTTNEITSADIKFKGYNVEGIIGIPKINIKYPIIDHTDEKTMKVSVTKFWGPKPNEIGNYTIAGHNNRDGTMFGKTKRLKIGDVIKITGLNNQTIEYKIFDIYSIDPNNVSIVNSVNSDTREVTLITCTNGHKNRLITKARQIQ